MKRALLLAVSLGVALLVVTGAWLLMRSSPEQASSSTVEATARTPSPLTPGTASAASSAGPAVGLSTSTVGPTSEEPAPTSVPTAAPEPTYDPGILRRIRVTNTEGQGANLRRDPSTTSERVIVVREGAELELIGPNRQAEGRTWRNVQDADGNAGWVPSEFLADERVAGPRPTATPAPPPIQVADITSPVARGAEARLVITTRPGLRCEVRVLLFGPAAMPRQGLEPKVADDRGECAWAWTVPDSVVPGTWRYQVIVSGGARPANREIAFGVT